MNRRAFLFGLSVAPLAARTALASPASPRASILGCADNRAHDHFAVGFDADGTIQFKLALPARGHGFARNPARAEAIVFARRPGSFAGIIDLAQGRMAAMIAPPRARNFYGHGTYSADGAHLYVCEHDDPTGNGFIGVYDAARGYRRIGEFAAGGVGPHEIRLMPDGKTLAVAIGGIQTDGERDKLNIDTMDPSLVYLDTGSGRLLEQVRPPRDWHQLSMRHIDVDATGAVALAMQYEGDGGASVPLAAIHRRGGDLQFLRVPDVEERRLRHYLGSIAFDRTGATLVATSPRGSVAAVWDGRRGAYLDMEDTADGCGLVATADGFVVAGGDGRLRQIGVGSNRPITTTEWMWDNHLLGLG